MEFKKGTLNSKENSDEINSILARLGTGSLQIAGTNKLSAVIPGVFQ